MKTLTEFSALVLRKAAEALAKVRASAPPAPAPADPGPAEVEAAPAAAPAPVEGAEPAPEEPAAAEAVEAAPAAAAGPDPIAEAVAAELGVQPDRAARLIEALEIIGDRIDQVRNVRVYQGDKGTLEAVSRGEFHYAIDRVAAPQRRGRDRDDRRGGRDDRRGGGGGGGGAGGAGGFGGRGGRDKPRGLGSLTKTGAAKDDRDPSDDRPGRGEMPRAGIGWQLQSAPRDFSDRGGGRGGPKRGGPRRGPGGPGGPRGPGGAPGGDRRDGRGRDRDRDRGPRGPRDARPMPGDEAGHAGLGAREPRDHAIGLPDPGAPPAGPPIERQPQLGPDGQPLPPRKKRPRKPMGPDANGLGPDGTPWDPERRAKRLAERGPQEPESGAVNSAAPTPVENATPPASPAETPTE